MQATNEQQRADQKHQGERDLRDHQNAAQAEALASIGEPTAGGFHQRAGVRTSGADGGHQSKKQTGEHTQGSGESEYSPVSAEIHIKRVIGGSQKPDQIRAEELGQESAAGKHR